jgi:YidC/Oxa1 family membrane protein insertase
MDRNNIIGIVIIFILLVGYSLWMQPGEEEQLKMQQKRDSLIAAQIEEAKLDSIYKIQKDSAEKVKDSLKININGVDSLQTVENKNAFGIFSASASGKQQFITLYNKNLKVKLSTLGGYPYYGELLNFKTFEKKPLVLFDDNENVLSLNLYVDNKSVSTKDLYFTSESNDTIVNAGESTKSVKLRLNAGEGKYIEYVYTLEPNSYELKYNINIVGLSQNIASNASYIDMIWDSKSRRHEKGAEFEDRYTTTYYKYVDDKVQYLSETKDKEEEKLDTKVKWIAYKGHFFSSVLIANDALTSAVTSYTKDQLQEKYLKSNHTEITLPHDNKGNDNLKFTFYLGPNDYDILKKIEVNKDENLELKRMIPLGWALFRWVNQYIIIPLFNLLDGTGLNYGIIILIMTFIIKTVLFPFTYKSFSSSAKMRVLKPQIDAINAKIPKEKTMERQQATMSLYKKVGVNPLGGCLPMLFQFPILIAMYLFFPSSIELRQQPFLWADDLSSYDSILNLGFTIPMYGDHISLFTLLMSAAILISTIMNGNQMNGSSNQLPGMKLMMYLMPVMMLVWFNNYSSGLSYYYFLSNLITIAQTLIIRKMINEDDLLAKLNANKKKEVKKSKFQTRLELMAKESTERRKK